MRFIISFYFAFFILITCRAQHTGFTSFTVNDGLPSNYIYRCLEDDKGFLWVATDAGIARFDGKHFQVFTTKQGLPDNEVLAVIKENNGRIWVNCFKQSPAYFDEVQNRFINSKDDTTLAKIKESTLNMYSFTLKNGGVMYVNNKGSFILRDKKLIAYYPGKMADDLLIKENDNGTQLKVGGTYSGAGIQIFTRKIYHVDGAKYVDSVTIKKVSSDDIFKFGVNDDRFYAFNFSKKTCYIFSDFEINPLRFKLDSVSISETFNNFEFTPDHFYLLGNSGKLYLFNKKTLQQEVVLSGNYLSNSMYKDSKGNMWVCTIDKGLLLYKKKQFNAVNMPDDFNNTNFLSIACKEDGTLLAGNFYGEIIETNKKTLKINSIPNQDKVSRQRKILFSQNKIFTFSENGIYINYKKALKKAPSNIPVGGKTAINYNDSIIIIGQSTSLEKLNTITEKIVSLNAMGKRITALTKSVDGMVYFGSTDGLYKYIYDKNISVVLNKSNPLLGERITSLCATPDKLLWVATSGNGLVIVKDDTVLLHIGEKEGIINNASRSITAGKAGQIWLGTSEGLSLINYKLQHHALQYTIQNLSVNDGLTNNVINEMIYHNDTLYAATSDGITVIPVNVSIPTFNIPVEIIQISINQQDTSIASNYDLRYDQQNILIRFAGIELSGHFKNLQYSLDENKTWFTLNDNTLTLQLNHGKHNLRVRAVDVNGNISNKILTIQFNIATPFWKTIWFWIIVVLIIQLLSIYFVSKWLKKRKQTKLAKEIASVKTASLEQQAFTSLMNPHFMFNALNSIQHYINVQDRQNANRYLSDFASLIRKNFEAAQQSFIPLEQELENVKIYLRLEQMRFTNRFTYKINIDDNLDLETWMIPTMMLQPLLENALLHGIMPSTIGGELIIDLKELNKNLLITITDNGIGIKNSLAFKQGDQHKSRGMELIMKRITALKHFVIEPFTINMCPAFEKDKNPGNKITLLIPEGLYNGWLNANKKY
jgi:ligand-binding sensor domain-containing protein/two-component sensor histidine kinase